MDLYSLKDRVTGIVSDAAALIRDTAFSVEQKGTASDIVTSSDIAVQKYLIKQLSPLIEGAGFFCEENVCDISHEYIWIIDPIDGTTNYARGIANCGISVALSHGGEIILGVVCEISSGDAYAATLGGGATLNGKPIGVSDKDFASSIFCTAMSLYRKEYAKVCSDIILDTYMQCNDVRRFGSCALELCYLAQGKCDLYFEIRVFPWDYAAAYLILREAGGVAYALADRALDFSSPTAVVAANNAKNYAKLSQIVGKYLTKAPYEE